MIEAIKSWVSNLIAIILFISLIELLLPSSKSKKYIGIFTGMLIVITIITPVAKVLGKEVKFELPNIKEYKMDQSEIQKQSNQISKMQSQQVLRVFQQKLEADMQEKLANLKYSACQKVSCQVSQDINNFNQIEHVDIYVKEKNEQEEIKGIKKIDININMEKPKNKNQDNKVPEEAKQEIIKILTTTYGIDSNKITINLLTDN
jgi:stage III sporulation protein AF